MAPQESKSLIRRIVDGLIYAGAGPGDEADHHGIIGNYFVLAFIFFAYFMIVMLVMYMYRLYDIDPAAVDTGIDVFGQPIIALLIAFHGYFLVRKFSRIPFELLVLGVIGVGVYWIFHMALLLGPGSYYFTYLFIVIPIPFLVYGTKQKGYLITAVCVPVVALAVYIPMLIGGLKAHFPMPEPLSTEIRILVLSALAGNFVLIGFIFWRENHRLQAALQESNAELKEKDGMLQLELDFAADIQQGLLPPKIHRWENVSLLCSMQPMHKVSGDYYDYFEFENELYVLLADISGHGVPAALVTMLAKQSFITHIQPGTSPSVIFSAVNEDLCRLIKTHDYLTAFLIRITEDEFEYCNAGHIPGVFVNSGDKDTLTDLDSPGLFVGSFVEATDSYQPVKKSYRKGDQILLMTDGVLEARDKENNEYSRERLLGVVGTQRKHSAPAAIFEYIMQDWSTFTSGTRLQDDVTLLSIGFS